MTEQELDFNLFQYQFYSSSLKFNSCSSITHHLPLFLLFPANLIKNTSEVILIVIFLPIYLIISDFILFQISMIKAGSQAEQVQYIIFKDLSEPSQESILIKNVVQGLESKEWRINFDTITHLREANKFKGDVLISELLPKISDKIIEQIDNLRSNNSREALTLAYEIIQHQNIQKLQKNVICPLVSALFNKTTCQKAFLKKQALGAVQKLVKKYNPYLVHEIGNQILSLNSNISQLGAKILSEYMENNKITDVDGEFFSLLIRTINGKRAVLQKKGKQIFNNFKKRIGEEKLNEMVDLALKSQNITEEQHRALIQEIKKQQKQVKNQQSLKDYLKMKKKADNV